jgi:hypothetical protein
LTEAFQIELLEASINAELVLIEELAAFWFTLTWAFDIVVKQTNVKSNSIFFILKYCLFNP